MYIFQNYKITNFPMTCTCTILRSLHRYSRLPVYLCLHYKAPTWQWQVHVQSQDQCIGYIQVYLCISVCITTCRYQLCNGRYMSNLKINTYIIPDYLCLSTLQGTNLAMAGTCPISISIHRLFLITCVSLSTLQGTNFAMAGTCPISRSIHILFQITCVSLATLQCTNLAMAGTCPISRSMHRLYSSLPVHLCLHYYM